MLCPLCNVDLICLDSAKYFCRNPNNSHKSFIIYPIYIFFAYTYDYVLFIHKNGASLAANSKVLKIKHNLDLNDKSFIDTLICRYKKLSMLY